MDFSPWYALGLAVFSTLLLVIHFLWPLICHGASRTLPFLYRVFVYYRITVFWRFSKSINISETIAILCLIVTNVVFIVFKSQDISNITQRTGRMMLVNLIPLSLGSRVNAIIWPLNIEPQKLNLLHEWVGMIAIIEGIIHVIVGAIGSISHIPHDISVVDILVSRGGPISGIVTNRFAQGSFHAGNDSVHFISLHSTEIL